MTNENKIVAGICLIFFMIIGYLFWVGPSINQSEPIAVSNVEFLVRDTSHMTGTKTAKVTMVEFGDYQCPACSVIYVELKKVIDDYEDDPNFNYVFRNFPLRQHNNAMLAAEVAESAGAQGKYFEMEDALYKNQSEWYESDEPMPLFTKYAIAIGLEMIAFESDIAQHRFTSTIQADIADGTALLVSYTPTVYINGVEQRDLSYVALKTKIEELLAK